jgi:hypothetical protein
MGAQIVFTIKLTSDDWDAGLSAWRCPAVDIPSAFIKDAYAGGQQISNESLAIDKGPARIRWRGARRPTELYVAIALGEKLSLVSAENFWKRLAIVVPIITAVIGVIGGWLTVKPGPGPIAHNLYFRVDPNDLKDSGMPPAKISLNNLEINQALPYKVDSDITAVVDTTAAYRAFVNNRAVVGNSIRKLDLLFGSLDAHNAHVNGNICSGGAHGEPSVERPQLSKEITDISGVLRDVRSELGVMTK